MIKIMMIGLITILTSCGPRQSPIYLGPEQGIPGSSCTVQEDPEGALITCEDGSSTLIKHGSTGEAGSDGTNGTDGEDGEDAEVIIVPCPGKDKDK